MKGNWIIKRNIIKFLDWREKNISRKNFLMILSLIIGLCAGFLALFLKTGVFYLHNLFLDTLEIKYSRLFLLVLPIIGISLTVLFRKYVIRDFCKHNISAILHSISQLKSRIKSHKIFSSITGAIFTAGFGGSVGLESPIISSGSAFGSNLGRILKLEYKDVTLLLACGSAAGVSAIFNTPIAGIVFAIEVLMIDLTRHSLIPLLLSSVSGTIVTFLFYKEGIMFDIGNVDDLNISIIPYYILFSVFIALISLYFTKVSLFFEEWFLKFKNVFLRFFYGASFLGILLFLFPGLYGEGYRGINNLMKDNYDALFYGSPFEGIMNEHIIIYLGFFLILALLKVLATSITLGAGGIGGIFAPSVFTGGVLGFVFAMSINSIAGYNLVSIQNFILVGMAGCLTGVLHAPLTGIFLISEITQSYELIVPLLIVSTITFIIVKAIEPNSIFTKQLAIRGELITHNKDKAVLTFMRLKNLIEKNFGTIAIDANLKDLVEVISKSRRNIFPVLDDDKKLVGIIQVENIRNIIFKQELYNNTFVKDLMKPPLAIIDLEDPMNVVIDKFNETKAWNLPVTQNGKYLGFVSKSTLFAEYRELLRDMSED